MPNVANPLQVLATSGLSFSIAPGSAVVPSSGGVTAGPYLPVNNVTQTLTHNAADPTNPRIDLVSIQVVDNGNNTSFGQIVITQGTAAASPTVPATPTNAIPLSQNRINAGATTLTQPNITDVRVYSAAPGGIVICPNMAALPTGWAGQLGYDITNNRLFHLSATGAAPIHVLGFPPALSIKTTNTAVPSTAETTLLSVNFTADGVSDYEYIGRFGDATNTVGRDWMHFRMYVDSTLTQDNQVFAFQPAQTDGLYHYGCQNVIHVTSGTKGTTPAAGAHTVSLRVANPANATTIVAASYMPLELSVKQATL
jgi:hypothetical protein